jgi:exonuclease VII large subunit
MENQQEVNIQDNSGSDMKISPLMVAIAGLVISITNPTTLNAQDCSKIEDFSKQLNCELKQELKNLADAKSGLADAKSGLVDAKSESKRLDKEIVTSTKRANKAVNKLIADKTSYANAKTSYANAKTSYANAKTSYANTKDNYKTIIADLDKMNKGIEELGKELMR